MEIAVRMGENGFIKLGWNRVKIKLLKKRPVQCFKCWHFGHVRSAAHIWTEPGRCFRCGLTGHSAGNCNISMPRCVVCEGLGKDCRHRLGTPKCLENQGFPSGVQQIKRIPLAISNAATEGRVHGR